MRPDLFEGPALRDDSHRILARLANGGSLPAPARQLFRWRGPRLARIGAVTALLATGAAAWVWLNDESAHMHPAPAPAVSAEPSAPSLEHRAASGLGTAQAATIVNASAAQNETSASTFPAKAAAPAAPAEIRPPLQRSTRPTVAQRKMRSVPAATENDEDVALLAAMLKHAGPQKPLPTPPKD
jgi:hypothetical protein